MKTNSRILSALTALALFFAPIAGFSEVQNQSIQQQQLGVMPAEPPVEAQIIAKIDGSIYELDWVLKTDEYQNAKTQKKKEQILEDSFKAQKNQKAKAIAAGIAGKKMLSLLIGNIVITGVAGALWYFLPQGMGAGWGLGALSYGYLMWALMSMNPGAQGDAGFISITKKMFDAFGYSSGVRQIGDAFNEVELMYAKKYGLLKEKNPKLLAELKAKLIEMRNDTLEALMYYKGYVKMATSVPVKRGVYHFSQEKFDQYYKYFPNSIKKPLRNIIGRLSYFSQGLEEQEKLNFPIYFVGIPGSGKTFAAMGIGKVLEAPVARVALDGATIEDVVGTPHSKSGKAEPGRLLTALSNMAVANKETNFENGVLFVDEFDRLLNSKDPQSQALLSFMLKMLDPSNRKFFSPYLNAEVKLPTLIILAGNYEIKDEALSNRFQIVRFTGFDIETKLKIVHEKLLPDISSIYNYKPSDFSATEMAAIETVVKNDKSDKGLRNVELSLILYIEEKRLNTFYDTLKKQK